MSGGAGVPPARIAAILEEQRGVVLARAQRRYPRIPLADLEDIHADTVEALLRRDDPIYNEEHLVGALWQGIHFRTGHWARRSARSIPVEHERVEELAGAEPSMEAMVLRGEEELLARDLLSELTEPEKRVLKLRLGEGLSRGRAARALGVPVPELRRLERSGRAKLDRLALIVLSGRLCQRRAESIVALADRGAPDELAEQARRHLEHCRACRREFARLRKEARRRSAAILPLPALVAHSGLLGGLDRLGARGRHIARTAGSRPVAVPTLAAAAIAAGVATALTVLPGDRRPGETARADEEREAANAPAAAPRDGRASERAASSPAPRIPDEQPLSERRVPSTLPVADAPTAPSRPPRPDRPAPGLPPAPQSPADPAPPGGEAPSGGGEPLAPAPAPAPGGPEPESGSTDPAPPPVQPPPPEPPPPQPTGIVVTVQVGGETGQVVIPADRDIVSLDLEVLPQGP